MSKLKTALQALQVADYVGFFAKNTKGMLHVAWGSFLAQFIFFFLGCLALSLSGTRILLALLLITNGQFDICRGGTCIQLSWLNVSGLLFASAALCFLCVFYVAHVNSYRSIGTLLQRQLGNQAKKAIPFFALLRIFLFVVAVLITIRVSEMVLQAANKTLSSIFPHHLMDAFLALVGICLSILFTLFSAYVRTRMFLRIPRTFRIQATPAPMTTQDAPSFTHPHSYRMDAILCGLLPRWFSIAASLLGFVILQVIYYPYFAKNKEIFHLLGQTISHLVSIQFWKTQTLPDIHAKDMEIMQSFLLQNMHLHIFETVFIFWFVFFVIFVGNVVFILVDNICFHYLEHKIRQDSSPKHPASPGP